nr:hypothetical protein [Tanacetum cinerariifolium]
HDGGAVLRRRPGGGQELERQAPGPPGASRLAAAGAGLRGHDLLSCRGLRVHLPGRALRRVAGVVPAAEHAARRPGGKVQQIQLFPVP